MGPDQLQQQLSQQGLPDDFVKASFSTLLLRVLVMQDSAAGNRLMQSSESTVTNTRLRCCKFPFCLRLQDLGTAAARHLWQKPCVCAASASSLHLHPQGQKPSQAFLGSRACRHEAALLRDMQLWNAPWPSVLNSLDVQDDCVQAHRQANLHLNEAFSVNISL